MASPTAVKPSRLPLRRKVAFSICVIRSSSCRTAADASARVHMLSSRVVRCDSRSSLTDRVLCGNLRRWGKVEAKTLLMCKKPVANGGSPQCTFYMFFGVGQLSVQSTGGTICFFAIFWKAMVWQGQAKHLSWADFLQCHFSDFL